MNAASPANISDLAAGTLLFWLWLWLYWMGPLLFINHKSIYVNIKPGDDQCT